MTLDSFMLFILGIGIGGFISNILNGVYSKKKPSRRKVKP